MNANAKPIVCCGFTPCIQRIIEFTQVQKGAVNRAKRVTLCIGGKGANTARIINQLGATSVLVGFAGGANGRLLENMLAEEKVSYRHITVREETRICQTLVEMGNSETTELVEEMPPIDGGEWSAMEGLFESIDLERSIVAISGKLPAGAPLDAYARVAAIVSKRGGQVIVDAPGAPLLATLEHEPFMVKINDVELLQTIGGEDLIDAALRVVGRGARSVLITRGALPAFYVDEHQTLQITPPKINAVNPVGSGDAVTAAVAVAVSAELPVRELLCRGMACGAANALNLKSGMIRMSDLERLMAEVQIKTLPSMR